MEIICAGYPKTGSKSCSAALRVLGYNVADYLETCEFMSETWLKFLEGKIDAKAVLDKYKEQGFDANQDIPGNMLWEELYAASPKGQKVILTVRESDERWWKSWCGFMKQEIERFGFGDFNMGAILNEASRYGYMGPEFKAMYDVGVIICSRYLSPALTETYWSVENNKKAILSDEFRLRQGYRKHNCHVIATVPKEDLLVWDLKEGWEPLCKFLNKPIPDQPIPHDNKTGDAEYIKKYFLEAPLFQNAGNTMMKYFALDVVKISIFGYCAYKTYQTNGEWLQTKIDFVSQKIAPLIKKK